MKPARIRNRGTAVIGLDDFSKYESAADVSWWVKCLKLKDHGACNVYYNHNLMLISCISHRQYHFSVAVRT